MPDVIHKIKLTNKLNQALPIHLTDPNGKVYQATLRARGTRIINATEMTQVTGTMIERGWLKREDFQGQ